MLSREREEGGFVAAQVVLIWALSLGFLLTFVGLMFVQYARASVRAALTDGARVAATADGTPEECEAKVREVLQDLVPKVEAESGGGVECEFQDFSAPVASAPTRVRVVARIRDVNLNPFPYPLPGTTGDLEITVGKRLPPS